MDKITIEFILERRTIISHKQSESIFPIFRLISGRILPLAKCLNKRSQKVYNFMRSNCDAAHKAFKVTAASGIDRPYNAANGVDSP